MECLNQRINKKRGLKLSLRGKREVMVLMMRIMSELVLYKLNNKISNYSGAESIKNLFI